MMVAIHQLRDRHHHLPLQLAEKVGPGLVNTLSRYLDLDVFSLPSPAWNRQGQSAMSNCIKASSQPLGAEWTDVTSPSDHLSLLHQRTSGSRGSW